MQGCLLRPANVRAQIAGLDVGWGQRIDMEWDAATKRHVVTRSLPPGRYPYKFVMDGRWSYSADHPTFTVRAPGMLLQVARLPCTSGQPSLALAAQGWWLVACKWHLQALLHILILGGPMHACRRASTPTTM